MDIEWLIKFDKYCIYNRSSYLLYVDVDIDRYSCSICLSHRVVVVVDDVIVIILLFLENTTTDNTMA